MVRKAEPKKEIKRVEIVDVQSGTRCTVGEDIVDNYTRTNKYVLGEDYDNDETDDEADSDAPAPGSTPAKTPAKK